MAAWAREARVTLSALGACVSIGCGSSVILPADGGGGSDVPSAIPLEVASNANPAVFEGQSFVVSVLTVAGADLTGASVTSESPHLEVREFVCVAERCAVVVAVPDLEPDVGRSIPAPIDASNRYLRIRQSGQPDRRALFSVAPLDAIRNVGDEATVRGTYFAASVASVDATVFRGALGREPVRWFVFGDATLRGRVDVSARGAEPGPGGVRDESSGGDGSASRGAGGGGSASPGEPGEGDPVAPGGAAFGAGCAADAFASQCGGSAGGAGAGESAAGAGVFAIVVLGALSADVEVSARGADGADGGGGGGGGRVLVAGRAEEPGITVDSAGGSGDPRTGSAGGDGGAGESSVVEASVTQPAGIVRDSSLTISGFAPLGRTVAIERLDGAPLGQASVEGDGTFSISVALQPGLNRLRAFVVDGASRARIWTGNHFELERRETAILPVGALIDVAYLP